MTLAKAIRGLAARGQYGHSRTPRNFYMTEGGCSFYWGDSWKDFCKTQDQWDRACRLLARYHRFVAFVEGWKPVGTPAYYADNSVQITEVSRQGATRQRCVVAAGGDACY